MPISRRNFLIAIALAAASFLIVATSSRFLRATVPSTPAAAAPATPPTTLTAAQKAAAEKMLASAKAALAAISANWEITKLTPEFVELRIRWARNVLSTELLLHPTGDDRKAALAEYLKFAKDTLVLINARKETDADQGIISEGEYAVAEAEFLIASDGQQPGPLPIPATQPSPIQKAAAERLKATAQSAYDSFINREPITRFSLEFAQALLDAAKRSLDARLVLVTDKKIRVGQIQTYIDQITSMHQKTMNVRDGSPIPLLQAEYAIAEAEYLLAIEE